MRSIEKLVLQIVVAVACLVPIGAGLAGVLDGPRLFADDISGVTDLDSQFRYLSGLLLAVGLFYAANVARIEKNTHNILLLTGIVVIGGLGRAAAALSRGLPSHGTAAALAMELVVVPAIALWQLRIARQARCQGTTAVPSISTVARGSTRRLTSMTDIAGKWRPMTRR
jgi:hypothetical protein